MTVKNIWRAICAKRRAKFEIYLTSRVGPWICYVDAKDKIASFVEKPANPPAMPGDPNKCLASMGIYVFETKFLFDQLERDAAAPNSSQDFGKDIIPYIVKCENTVAHRFSDSCVRSTNESEAY